MDIKITGDFNSIKWERRDNFILLSINRPDKLNALNMEVLTELKVFLTQTKSIPQIKGMVFTGEGERAFIAGADIKQMSMMKGEESLAFGLVGQEVTFLFESQPFPVIAAVAGFALGGGCEMAMSCDFIYATKNAIFGQPEVKLGLIPGFGGTQRLARLVGRNRAKELIYTGRNIPVDLAQTWGLVTQVYENREELLEGAFKTLGEVAKNGPRAIAIAKRVMNQGNDIELNQALKMELDQFSGLFQSPEMQEGTTAFIEKRTPKF